MTDHKIPCEMPVPEGHYLIEMSCPNCFHVGFLAIKKGVETPKGATVCPNCECYRFQPKEPE